MKNYGVLLTLMSILIVIQGNVITTLTGHTGIVTSVAFSPDGDILASGNLDKTILLWNVTSADLILTITGHNEYVNAVSFSPDGATLASGSHDSTVKSWDVSSGGLITTMSGHTGAVNSVAISPNGIILASGGNDKTVKLWIVLSGELTTTMIGHTNIVYSIAFSPNGALLASSSFDTTVHLWNVASGDLITTMVGDSKSYGIDFSPDGKTLVSGSENGNIKLWNVPSGELIFSINGHSDLVTNVKFSPDGATLASGSWDNTIKLWNILSEDLFYETSECTQVYTLAFSPDGSTIASGFNKTIILWDVPSEIEDLKRKDVPFPAQDFDPKSSDDLPNSVVKHFSLLFKGHPYSVKLEAQEIEKSHGVEGVTKLEALQIQVVADESSQMYSLYVDKSNIKDVFPHFGGTLESFYKVLSDLFAQLPETLGILSLDLAVGVRSLEMVITSSMPYNSFVSLVQIPAVETSETKRLQHQVYLLLRDKREAEERFIAELSKQRELFNDSMIVFQDEVASYIQTQVVQELELVRSQIGSIVRFTYGWIDMGVEKIDVTALVRPDSTTDPRAYATSSGATLTQIAYRQPDQYGSFSEKSGDVFFRPHAHFTLYDSNELKLLRLCPKIKILNLSNNYKITNLSFLASLVALEELDLSGCTGISSLDVIPSLPVLNRLVVAGCRSIVDLQPLSEMSQLRTLDISNTGVINRLPVAGLINLNIIG